MGGVVKSVASAVGLGGGDTVVAPPPPPPAMDNSKEIASAQEAERLRRASAGRASTVLAGDLAEEPETATKKLLGA